jgi:hypothetical protein
MLKNRTYLALTTLIVVGGAAVWKVTRPDPHAATAPVGAAKWDVKKDAIDELTIAAPGKPEVVLKKDGADWKLDKPVADRADPKAVDQALDAITGVKLRDVIAELPESYEKVGVKDDQVIKVVAKKGGAALGTLLVGKTVSTSTNVRIEGDPKVYSTVDLKRFALDKDVKMWRDRSVLALPADKLDHVELDYPAAKMVVRKEAPASQPARPDGKPAPKAPDKWIVTEGQDKIGGALDDSVPTGLVSTLARLEADDFVDGGTADDKNGLAHPRVTVTATTTDGATKTLLVGLDDGATTYAMLKDGPRIWKLHKYEADRFPTSPAQWRDKTIVKLEPKEVQKIELDKDKDRVVLERVDDKSWKATTPKDLGELDQAPVQALLRAMTALRAARVVDNADPKAAGLDKPTGVATFTKKDGSVVKLTLGAEKANEYTVSVSGQKDVYALSDYQAKQFVKTANDFKKKAAPPPRPGGM